MPMSTDTAARHEPRARRAGTIGMPFLHVARFELLRQFRRRRLLILLIIAALLVTLLVVVFQVFGTPSGVYTYMSSFAGFVTILAALAATFFGADALVGEFEHHTGYFLFPQPVTRASIFLGKALAALALTVLTLGAYYGIVAAATRIVMGSLPIELAYSFLLAILYAIAALGLAFFLSSAMRTTTVASVLTFTLLFFVLTFVGFIINITGVRPDGNLAFAGQTISDILSGPYPEAYPGDVTVPGPGGSTITLYSPAVVTSIGVMVLWALVGFALALLLYRRREMKG